MWEFSDFLVGPGRLALSRAQGGATISVLAGAVVGDPRKSTSATASPKNQRRLKERWAPQSLPNQETRKERGLGRGPESHPLSCVTNSSEVWTILCEPVHKDSGQTGEGTRAGAFAGSVPSRPTQFPSQASRCGRFRLPLRQSVLTRGTRTESSAALRERSTEEQRAGRARPRGRKEARTS